jgi:hypothetical protein
MIRKISPDLSKIAAEELNECPERIAADLQAFKEWILKSPHIKSRMDDQFLIAFLRGCKYSLERAKSKLDMYYSARCALPEIMKNRDPCQKKLREMIRLGVGLPLPVLETPDSPRIFLIRTGIFDPNEFTIVDVFKVAEMMRDILLLEDDNCMIAGNITIVDFKGITRTHLLQLNPTLIKKLSMLNQEGSPFRQKGFHFTNVPPSFEMVLNMFKTMLTGMNRNKYEKGLMTVHVHPTTNDTLLDHIPRKCLPTEYGGTAGSLQSIIDYWENKIDSYRDYFLEDEKFGYGVDETRRIDKLPNRDILHGSTGSFRKLEID